VFALKKDFIKQGLPTDFVDALNGAVADLQSAIAIDYVDSALADLGINPVTADGFADSMAESRV